MPKKASLVLESKKQFVGGKPAVALVNWLNTPENNTKLVERLLHHAQVVFGWTSVFGSIRELNLARKSGKLPEGFWRHHRRLNQTLAQFTFAPQIDLHELPDGERVSWMLTQEEPPLALFSGQIRLFLQIAAQGAVLKIRRCKQCSRWYFAHFPHQGFCTTKCRVKHQGQSPEFKAHRRKYMRDWYYKQKKNVK